jgi:hypothetical protein
MTESDDNVLLISLDKSYLKFISEIALLTISEVTFIVESYFIPDNTNSPLIYPNSISTV